MKKAIALFVVIVVVIIIIKILSPFVVVSIRDTNITANKWIHDIEYLKEELPKRHIDPFHNITKNDYDMLFSKLINDIEKLNSDEIMIRILEILSSINDSHTNIGNYFTSTDSAFPIKVSWINDGYYIIDTIEEYKDVLGYKIISINGVLINDIDERLTSYISHENNYRLYREKPQFIRDPRMLRYLNVIESEEAEFLLEHEAERIIKDMKIQRINDIEFYNKNLNSITTNNEVTYYEDEKVIYVEVGVIGVKSSIVDDIVEKFEKDNYEKLIIDLRNHTGGTFRPNNKFIRTILSNEKINKKGSLYVLIGRNTFSSGVLYAIHLRDSNAIFYGEPTGGKPNHYGEVRNIKLPNSKLIIRYSTKQFHFNHYEDSLYPDIEVPMTVEDYLTGSDSILNKIIHK